MATGKEFIAYLQDCLRYVDGLSYRAMFGEYAMYAHDVVIGLVCDQTVFVKVTPGTSVLLDGRAGTGQPYPGAKPWFMLTEDELLDEPLMRQLVAVLLRDLPVKKARPRKTAKPTRPARAAKPAASKPRRRR
ncbi:MAG: TfoX/Sxy family protein [Proteobacteria bacterium]|nr:TfoX/Sxy family protein [Pseudomonadota bacterium]